ncbi:MAG: methyltransferase domain-containing protein, partial [Alphaproteobacteria bacterium]
LKQRWPDASMTGIDGSPEMLAVAHGEDPTVDWREADINSWHPGAPVDVLYSNAALHWLDGHEELFPRLLSMVAGGGALAVQMPSNPDAPFQALMSEVARDGPWWDALAPVLRPDPVGAPGFYYDLLRPHAAHVELWETIYAQVLSGDNPILDWVRGSRLRPLLAALDEPVRSAYEAAYAARLLAAYPKLADGDTMLPFRRLFLIAVA